MAALAEPDVQFAHLAEIRSPVANVQRDGLADPQTGSPPQRRGQIVPCSGQVLPGVRQRVAPPGEQDVDLQLGGRHTRDLGMRLARPVELIDRLANHAAGQGVDVALVTGDQKLEELAQRGRLAENGVQRLLLVAAQPQQITIRVRRLSRPHRTRQELDELEQRRPLVRHVTIGDAAGGHRQRVLVDQLLLEVLELLSRRQLPRRPDRANDCQLHVRTPVHRTNDHVGNQVNHSGIPTKRQPSGIDTETRPHLLTWTNTPHITRKELEACQTTGATRSDE
ncbi:hypothetical protein [Actinophytocola sediminis]